MLHEVARDGTPSLVFCRKVSSYMITPLMIPGPRRVNTFHGRPADFPRGVSLMLSKRFLMVLVLSSAARIPLFLQPMHAL
jgi:hypothetical protein